MIYFVFESRSLNRCDCCSDNKSIRSLGSRAVRKISLLDAYMVLRTHYLNEIVTCNVISLRYMPSLLTSTSRSSLLTTLLRAWRALFHFRYLPVILTLSNLVSSSLATLWQFAQSFSKDWSSSLNGPPRLLSLTERCSLAFSMLRLLVTASASNLLQESHRQICRFYSLSRRVELKSRRPV